MYIALYNFSILKYKSMKALRCLRVLFIIAITIKRRNYVKINFIEELEIIFEKNKNSISEHTRY